MSRLIQQSNPALAIQIGICFSRQSAKTALMRGSILTPDIKRSNSFCGKRSEPNIFLSASKWLFARQMRPPRHERVVVEKRFNRVITKPLSLIVPSKSLKNVYLLIAAAYPQRSYPTLENNR
jgi:hypothetical protein